MAADYLEPFRDPYETNAFKTIPNGVEDAYLRPRGNDPMTYYFTMLVAFTSVCFLAGLILVIDAVRRLSRR